MQNENARNKRHIPHTALRLVPVPRPTGLRNRSRRWVPGIAATAAPLVSTSRPTASGRSMRLYIRPRSHAYCIPCVWGLRAPRHTRWQACQARAPEGIGSLSGARDPSRRYANTKKRNIETSQRKNQTAPPVPHGKDALRARSLTHLDSRHLPDCTLTLKVKLHLRVREALGRLTYMMMTRQTSERLAW